MPFQAKFKITSEHKDSAELPVGFACLPYASMRTWVLRAYDRVIPGTNFSVLTVSRRAVDCSGEGPRLSDHRSG